MDAIINVVRLVVLALWSVASVEGAATITGCTDAFIRLQCPPGDTLSVHRLQLAAGDGGVSICSGGVSNRHPPPPVPPNLAHLCTTASECLYEEDKCVGKNDCVFYIGAQFLDRNGPVRDSSAVSITYDCESGTSFFGSAAGITIVTLGLAAALITAIFIICRRSRAQEEDATSKYVQFDKGLSRTPSMTSEHRPPVATGSTDVHSSMTDTTAHHTTAESYSSTDQDAIGGFVSRGLDIGTIDTTPQTSSSQDIETIDTTQITLPPSASIV